jgi:hypothetical protein
MTAPLVELAPSVAMQAARRMFARHVLRLAPGTGRCRLCGGAWYARGDGRRVDGCAARQLAAATLATIGQAATLATIGQLDADGHPPTRPPVLLLPTGRDQA